MVLRTILFILLMKKNLQTEASGYDAYSSCYRTSRKRQELPCDFGSQTWCAIPGNSYPWHAVRRFVHENQGLMRRMYGDERHISVLRAELESNDVEFFDGPAIKEEFRRRYSKDMDGTKEFVKAFINGEGRKMVGESRAENSAKLEKIQKSIEETSNNLLYESNAKIFNRDETEGKFASGRPSNETESKTTTTQETPETTYSAIETAAKMSQSNATSFVQTDSTTRQSPATDFRDSNFPAKNSTNETRFEENYDYVSETGEPPTTTDSDDLITTETYAETTAAAAGEDEQEEKGEEEKEKVEVEADEKEVHKNKLYQDAVEEAETIKQEQTEKLLASSQPPPMIRLKGINACPVKEEVVAPFWANNTRGEVLALLNLYPFEQYVHWEKCTYEHKQMFCREGCRCEQQYRLHRLLAYDPNNECRGIFSDWFRFPSCCVCKCYDLPIEFRLTSRSPRFRQNFENARGKRSPINDKIGYP